MAQPDPPQDLILPEPASLSTAPPEIPAEEPAPMLEVHAPHETIHTWKDFLIHIATIVLGLCIAVGLEQTVEYFHRDHQRHQLREDLRNETGQRVIELQNNQKVNAGDIAWYRDILRLSRETKPSNGIVTLLLPSRPPYDGPNLSRATNGVWTAAKASGVVSVLTREEIGVWDRIDFYNEGAAKSLDGREAALKAFYAVTDRTGTRPNPGATLLLIPADRDEFMHAVARLNEETWILERDNATWQGACEAALHGITDHQEMERYESRARRNMP